MSDDRDRPELASDFLDLREKPPEPLYEQLRMGGKMVVAVGSLVQEMQVITKTREGKVVRPVSLVNLGPMTHDGNR